MLDFIQKIMEYIESQFCLIGSYISGFQYGVVIAIIALLCIYLGKNLLWKFVAWITNQR